jgi:hypothetical protein
MEITNPETRKNSSTPAEPMENTDSALSATNLIEFCISCKNITIKAAIARDASINSSLSAVDYDILIDVMSSCIVG